MRPLFHAVPASPSVHLFVQWLAIALFLVLSTLLTGCASPPTTAPKTRAEQTSWSGRLALQVEEQAGQASQSFTAAFELQGNATQGELTLLNPLGNVLARIDWTPQYARLQSGGTTQESVSLDVLLEQITGTPLPVLALFDWLRGVQTTASGWQAHLGDIDRGRLEAKRYTPTPRAILRVTFEP
ncbi:lipoprotein insertase outer membrane protein LolB [Simplicispira psychrophila]|uniref:lipoprotein insertase outer membrane protein LolB n=1 Tax=Simplicispira psychrophila TaxID=80882 RepID=UPI00068D802B|nr:lipoprotein insertase outer membrane protein LolB [Simplicispira psychrophila]